MQSPGITVFGFHLTSSTLPSIVCDKDFVLGSVPQKLFECLLVLICIMSVSCELHCLKIDEAFISTTWSSRFSFTVIPWLLPGWHGQGNDWCLPVCMHQGVLVTPALPFGRRSVRCAGAQFGSPSGDSTASSWAESSTGIVGDSTPGCQGESCSRSACQWFILCAWRICLDFCRCIYLWFCYFITTESGRGMDR